VSTPRGEVATVTVRVLVVEDDVKLVRALHRGLGYEGYTVDVAHTGDEGLSLATAEDYAAIVLDLILPGLDGFAVCEELRRRDRWVPVLMLTALVDVSDRIRGLDGGADDYMVKPFDFGELLARLRVLIRRGPSAHPQVFEIGDLHVDSSTRMVTRAGHQVELTAREFDVLEVLARNADRLVTRSQLLDAVWHEEYEGSPNIADVYVGYLRRKLERPRGRRLIRTVRGKGFLLESS
jgi:two-component system, OmpR family, response regulator